MNKTIIKRLQIIENNARRLLEDTAALKEELSGGSDSSRSQALSLSQKQELINKRRKMLFKSNR